MICMQEMLGGVPYTKKGKLDHGASGRTELDHSFKETALSQNSRAAAPMNPWQRHQAQGLDKLKPDKVLAGPLR